MTHADLMNYKVKVQPALQGTYCNRTVYTSHAPSSGPVLLHMLNLVERYDFIKAGRTLLNAHRLVEAMKCKSSVSAVAFFSLIRRCQSDFPRGKEFGIKNNRLCLNT
jgi:gamma-glutamyltranspeptidase